MTYLPVPKLFITGCLCGYMCTRHFREEKLSGSATDHSITQTQSREQELIMKFN